MLQLKDVYIFLSQYRIKMVHPVDNIKGDKITPAYKYDSVNRPRTCTVFKTIDLHVIWGGGVRLCLLFIDETHVITC